MKTIPPIRFLITLVFIVLCLNLTAIANMKENEVTVILSKLGSSDREELEEYFKMLVTQSEFAFTLFGDKPMSIYGYFIKPPNYYLILTRSEDPQIERHWKTLEKYSHLFNFKNYLLIDQLFISPVMPTSGEVRKIILINKKSFLERVNENREIFKKNLKNFTTADALLSQIEENKLVFSEVLENNELLWGILLGYGTNNAKLYWRREELTQYGRKEGSTKPIPLVLSEGFSSFSEELEDILDRFTGLGDYHGLYLIPHPGFLCDERDEETERLRGKYLKKHKEVSEIYSEGSFLEKTLTRLMSE